MKLRDLKIGNRLITKEGILTLSFLSCLIGSLFGAWLYLSMIPESNTKSDRIISYILISFGLMILLFFVPALKKQIRKINK